MLVSYDDPNHLWPYFYEEVKSRLVVGRAEASSSPPSSGVPSVATTNVRPASFPLTTLTFVPFSQETTFAQRDMLSLHRQYLVHVSLIACDDLETYKRRSQAHLSNWLETIHGKKNQTCVIIQVTSHSGDMLSGSRSTPISRAELVFEQLSADFGGGKHAARIIQLRLKERRDENWGQTIDTLADAIYWSFWSQAGALAEDIQRLEAQKELPGWNFATFFAIKESLALVFKDASLFAEALAIYDQLLALFLSTVYPVQGAEWIVDGGCLDMELVEECLAGRAGPKDLAHLDSLRHSIAKGTSNLCDFFVYIFCNRVSLLAGLNDGTSVVLAALELSTHVSASADRVAQWKFELATLILALADSMAAKGRPQDEHRFGVARRLLILLARQQLAPLMSSLGQTPAAGEVFFASQELNTLGFTVKEIAMAGPSINIFEAGSWERIRGDQAAVLSAYKELTLAARDAVALSDRLGALLDFDLAMVHLLQGESETAQKTIDALIANPFYADWALIRKQFYLARSICNFKLADYEGALKDTLASWHPAAVGLVRRLGEIGRRCTRTLSIAAESLLTCVIRGTSVSDGKASLCLEITWHADEEVLFDRVLLGMASDRMDCQFCAAALRLAPQSTHSLELVPSAAPLAGSYTPVELCFCLGSIKLVKSFLSTTPKQSFDLTSGPGVCHIKLSMPDTCCIDRPQVQVTIEPISASLPPGELMVASSDVHFAQPPRCVWNLEETVLARPDAGPSDRVSDDLRLSVPAIPKEQPAWIVLDITQWHEEQVLVRVDYRAGPFSCSAWHPVALIPRLRCHFDRIGGLGRCTIQTTGKEPIGVAETWIMSNNEDSSGKTAVMQHNMALGPSVPLSRVLRAGDENVVLTTLGARPAQYIFQSTKHRPVDKQPTLSCVVSVNVGNVEYGAQVALHARLESSHAKDLAVEYELGYSRSCWMINGTTKGKCQVSKGNKVLAFTIVPIHSGTIALPSLAITLPDRAQDAVSIQRHSIPHCINVSQPRAREKIFVLRELSSEAHER